VLTELTELKECERAREFVRRGQQTGTEESELTAD
jgi:hypothetical protein